MCQKNNAKYGFSFQGQNMEVLWETAQPEPVYPVTFAISVLELTKISIKRHHKQLLCHVMTQPVLGRCMIRSIKSYIMTKHSKRKTDEDRLSIKIRCSGTSCSRRNKLFFLRNNYGSLIRPIWTVRALICIPIKIMIETS